MKNECDLVKDLLFSYNDNILSNTSKELVEEHLKKCDECKKILEEIKQDSNEKKQIKEIDFLKGIKKNINKKNIIILIVFIFLIIIILFNVQVYKNYNEIASTMEIYLKDDITEEQIENIKNKLIEKCDNIELEYVSKEKALERFKSNLGENENLLNDFNINNNPIPASINIKTDTDIKAIVEYIQDIPGIAHITTHINSNPYELYIQKIMGK
ncbi:MAG: permease-like cell division protein FtsX [Clostridia bacterium]|nr:permease-like cell division protein FtsX [Clostridia bacterium]